MSVPQGIVPLIKAFQDAQISSEDYLRGLEQAMAQCEHKKNQLITTSVRAQERQAWEEMIRPGLLACLDVMAGAALEAREYVHARDPQILQNVVMLFAQVDQATALLMPLLGQVSADTRSLATEVLDHLQADAVQLKIQSQGTAEPHVSMFD